MCCLKKNLKNNDNTEEKSNNKVQAHQKQMIDILIKSLNSKENK